MIRLATPSEERFLLALPGGVVDGQPVTLMKGDPDRRQRLPGRVTVRGDRPPVPGAR